MITLKYAPFEYLVFILCFNVCFKSLWLSPVEGDIVLLPLTTV